MTGNCGSGCMPGRPCVNGVSMCGNFPCQGSQQMCGPGIPCGGGMTCGNGPCYPNSGYLQNPALYGAPNGMSAGYTPQQLAMERQMLQNQLNGLNQVNNYQNQLGSLQHQQQNLIGQLNALNGPYNNALNGYNGILSNVMGPNMGNPGMYTGPGMPSMGGCGTGSCGCPICSGGGQNAYYAPPYVYGNAGYGSSAYGFPSNNYISAGFKWSGIPYIKNEGTVR